MNETEEQFQARLGLYFLADLEAGLKREAEFMSRNKEKYLEFMSDKDLGARMQEGGISLNDSPEKIRKLGNQPKSATRNGLIIHCVLGEL